MSRLRLIARVALFWVVVILCRLVYLQVIDADELRAAAKRQSHVNIVIPAPRGRILDRTGQTLAISVPADTIVVNPRTAPDLSVARDLFCPILGLDPERLQARIDWALKNHRGYLPIKQRVSPEESRKIRGLHLDWIEFHEDSRRRYPMHTVAANLLGGVNYRGEGNAGLELGLNAILRGRPGQARIFHDARGRTIHSDVQQPPRPGSDVGLAIDGRIQYTADLLLARAAREWNCERGSVVVVKPASGEILALASYPAFDPNEPVLSSRDLEARVNQAISVPFEPGSVFKVITLSAALETTDLTPSTMIDCGPGVFRLFGRRIHDLHAYGVMPLEKVLWKSSNIGAIQAGTRVGEKRLLEYVRRYGFGRRTGIPLPGESAGVVRDLNQWTRTSIASVSIGHEISATTLQLALAFSVVANGGLLPKPRLVLWRQSPDGKRIAEPLKPARRVLEPETAITMRRMMEGVVLHGTGRRARLRGYTSGGKTGSAQIFNFETHHYSHSYNASFIGLAPVTNPAIVVAVTLNKSPKYGGIVAAPVFQGVGQTALRILGTVPDMVDEDKIVEAVPEDELGDPAIADLGTPPEIESGTPELAKEKSADEEETLVAEQPNSPYVFGPRVPNFRGKTLRAVLEETSRMGVKLKYSGSGIAHAQYPAPGAVLPVGDNLVVEFAR